MQVQATSHGPRNFPTRNLLARPMVAGTAFASTPLTSRSNRLAPAARISLMHLEGPYLAQSSHCSSPSPHPQQGKTMSLYTKITRTLLTLAAVYATAAS